MKEKDNNILFFPSMGRCPLCGRFMKRGLVNWMDHIYDKCISPKAEEIRLLREIMANLIIFKKPISNYE